MLRPNPLSAPAGAHAVVAPPVQRRPPAGLSGPGSAAQPLRRSNILHYLLLVHLFLFCTRVHEFIPQVRVAAPLLLVLIVGAALTMRAGAILSMFSGKPLVAFTAWVGMCVPFSVWIGGSADLFQRNVQGLLTVALMAAFIQTVPEAIRAMYTVGFAAAFDALMSFVVGWEQGGRLVIGDGTLSDPNYYCLYVLVGLPFLWMATYIEPGIKRLTAVVVLLPVFMVIARTGSRGGLVALVAGLAFLFLVSSFKHKIYLSAAAMVMLFVGAVTLPSSLITRFSTIFDSEGDAMAADSSAARKELLIRSLQMTAQHPIFGVGPGMFTIGEAADAKTAGRKGVWHVTHNTYTQLSSEVGIPGALLFLFVLYRTYRGLSRVRRTERAVRIRNAALFTQMSLVIVSAAACFLSAGYGSIPYIIIGLSGTFLTAVANEHKTAKMMPASAAPPALTDRQGIPRAAAPANNSSYRRTTFAVE
jgi:O-antigen ligase